MPWENQPRCTHPDKPPTLGIAIARMLTGNPKVGEVWRCDKCGDRFELTRTDGALGFKKIGG